MSQTCRSSPVPTGGAGPQGYWRTGPEHRPNLANPLGRTQPEPFGSGSGPLASFTGGG